jgi:hypothetical protein
MAKNKGKSGFGSGEKTKDQKPKKDPRVKKKSKGK